jgi:hypothetical protein
VKRKAAKQKRKKRKEKRKEKHKKKEKKRKEKGNLSLAHSWPSSFWPIVGPLLILRQMVKGSSSFKLIVGSILFGP